MPASASCERQTIRAPSVRAPRRPTRVSMLSRLRRSTTVRDRAHLRKRHARCGTRIHECRALHALDLRRNSARRFRDRPFAAVHGIHGDAAHGTEALPARVSAGGARLNAFVLGREAEVLHAQERLAVLGAQLGDPIGHDMDDAPGDRASKLPHTPRFKASS